jgi:hypothetical protein
MNLPPQLQTLLDHEIAAVQRAPDHALLPYRRLTMYDAFGPTFRSETYLDRIQILQAGRLPLTRADRVRARLAILTAQRVFPLWYTALEEVGLLLPERIEAEMHSLLSGFVELNLSPEVQPPLLAYLAGSTVDYQHLRVQIAALAPHDLDSAKRVIWQECVTAGIIATSAAPTAAVRIPLDPGLVEQRSIYSMPITELPVHNLQLAEGLLRGTVDPSNAIAQSGDIRECFGNFLGYDEEVFPAQAYDVGMASYEALNQALGLGPFDRQEVTSTTTDAWLLGEGAAAAPALKAYSGVFEGTISTTEYDPDKQQEFWLWWLTEAIPQAWAAEPDQADPPDLATMPFTATVRVTAYRTGQEFTFDAPADDDA